MCVSLLPRKLGKKQAVPPIKKVHHRLFLKIYRGEVSEGWVLGLGALQRGSLSRYLSEFSAAVTTSWAV